MSDFSVTEEAGKVLRFGIVGIGATAVYYLAGLALNSAGWSPQWGNLAAYLAANSCSFAGHMLFTFKASGQIRSRVIRFAAVGLVGYVLSVGITALSFDVLKFDPWLALALVVISVTSVTFIASRFWIFTDAH